MVDERGNSLNHIVLMPLLPPVFVYIFTRSNHGLCSAFAMLAIEEHATTRLGCVLLPLSARIVYSLSLSA